MIRCSVQKGLEIARRFLKERSSRQYARTIENHLNAIIAKLERLDPEKVVWISYLGTSINFASRAAGDVLEMQGKIEGVPVTRMVTYFLTEAAGVKDVNNTAYVTWNQGIPSYHGSSNAPQPLNTSNTQQFDDSIVSCIRIPFINLKDQYAVHPSSMESALIGLLAPCCLNTALGNNKTFQINGFKYGDFIRGKASPITLAKTENTTRTGIVTPKSKRYRHSILAWLKIAKGWLRDYLLRYLWKPFSFLNVVDRFSAFHKDPTNPPSSMEEMISYSRSLREVRGAHVIDSTVVATLNPQEAQNEEKEEPEEALPPYKEYRKAFYPTSPRATLAGLEDPKSGREGEPKQYRLTCLIRLVPDLSDIENVLTII